MNPSIQLKRSIPLLLIVLVCFGFSPRAQAVVPPPDGGYPNQNTAEGDDALFNLTTGVDNTAIGFDALFSNTSGRNNTATGSQALSSNTTGISNTANGSFALGSNTTGRGNTALGLAALFSNTTATGNTATGTHALGSNTRGNFNTAYGWFALFFNTLGTENTASGTSALQENTTGSFNTAYGAAALANNETGNGNTATGFIALLRNHGNRNTANGAHALELNELGNLNLAEGAFALSHNISGSSNTALGFNAGSNLTTGNNNIDIGNPGVADESATIRIGTRGHQSRTFVVGIRGVTTGSADAIPVLIDSAGQLGTASSSRQYKTDVKPMDKTSESIFGLKPVSFRYKAHNDSTPQFGLIAEDVAEENPDLIVRDQNGEPYTVRYDAVNAMLLNEFLKEHRKVEQQQATISRLESAVAKQQANAAKQQNQLEALARGLQKLSAQVELSKSAPQAVLNNR